MRIEKTLISREYAARLNQSPYFLVVDYRGMSVPHFNEMRRRLVKAQAEIHVVKNSLFGLAAKEVGLPALAGTLVGQLAVVTGAKDVSAAAKVLKTFKAEFDRPALQFGYLKQQRLSAADILILADLPPLEALRAQLMGLINQPATRLVQIIGAPGQQLARVIKARVDKPE
jgi:large subunit ribosomal protein L10